MTARVAIVQFPGVNCESETALALERAGLTPEVFRWKRRPADLAEFQAYERLFSLWHALHLPLIFMLLVAAVVHIVAVHVY